jgi:general secretion pathway protein J
MSLLSVMMLLLFASLRICVQNWNAGEKKIAQVSQRAIVQNFFQSKLYTTLPLQANFFEEEQFSFQGNTQQLQFVAPMPSSVGKLGIQLFTLSLQPPKEGNGSDLSVSIRPFFPKNESEEWDEESIVILKNIQALRYTYFGADQAGDDPDWHDEWLEKTSLPRLVSIEIELANGDVWPQVVVALRIDAKENSVNGGNGSYQRHPLGIKNGNFTR